MLVLSRRRNTSIHIGSNIEVKILSIRNRQVKLGIEAPGSVRIWRDELCRSRPERFDGGSLPLERIRR